MRMETLPGIVIITLQIYHAHKQLKTSNMAEKHSVCLPGNCPITQHYYLHPELFDGLFINNIRIASILS